MKRYINNVGEVKVQPKGSNLECILHVAVEELLGDVEREIGMQLAELTYVYDNNNNHELFDALNNIKSLKLTRDKLVRYVDRGSDFKSNQWALNILGDWGYTVHDLDVDLDNMSVYSKYNLLNQGGYENAIYENTFTNLFVAFETYPSSAPTFEVAIENILKGDYRSRDPFFLWDGDKIKSLDIGQAHNYMDDIIIKGATL